MSDRPRTAPFAFLMKDRIIAPPGFNRWRIPPVSIAMHLCIGSVYSWSIFNPALTKEVGVVASAADDWSISSVVWIFSVAIVFLGLTAAVAGKWLESVGPRCVGVTAAFLWGGGFIVGGIGIHFHQLWLLYLGYGVLGGCGLGLGYVSPVSTLIRWFPYRRGMATGMAIMGFGGGAIIGAPLKEFLIKAFYEAPQYLGPVNAVPLITEQGRRFAQIGGQLAEVVVVGAADAANMIAPGMEGVYVANTGGTGTAQTFFTLGIVYFAIMLVASFLYRVPAEGWEPPRPAERSPAAGGLWGRIAARTAGRFRRRVVIAEDVHLGQAQKTPQFYLLWILLCFNVTAGIGVIGVAKTMMTDIFGSTLPHIVTPAFAAFYVLMISVFNMGGRFFWAFLSDFIGRKTTYCCFFAIGGLLYLSIPFAAGAVSADPAVVWLVMFYAATMIAFTMYGGGFATIPAYLADVFGTLHVGAIHGRLLVAWSVAGVLGPLAITQLREFSVKRAIHGLADKVDPAVFQAHFGAPLSSLEELIAAKTVTIAKLLEIAPRGTVDPTPGVYNITMYVMAGLLALAFFANLAIRPVAERHHLKHTHPELAAERAPDAGEREA